MTGINNRFFSPLTTLRAVTSSAISESPNFYIQADIPVETRTAIARHFADRIEINNQFWETGDDWLDRNTGVEVDIMYRSPQWIEIS